MVSGVLDLNGTEFSSQQFRGASEPNLGISTPEATS